MPHKTPVCRHLPEPVSAMKVVDFVKIMTQTPAHNKSILFGPQPPTSPPRICGRAMKEDPHRFLWKRCATGEVFEVEMGSHKLFDLTGTCRYKTFFIVISV